MKQSTFTVSRFTNRNGISSWRVDGRLHGLRIRKNFKTREEAGTEKEILEAKAAQTQSGLRTATTFLSDDQLREAEAVFRRMSGQPRPLGFYLDYALANYREPQRQKSLIDAAADYLAIKKREHERQLISKPQLNTIRCHLEVLKGYFPNSTVADLTAQRLTAYFQSGNAALKTYNNRRGVVSTFLKFAFQQDWITANPVEKIPYHRIAHRRGSAKTLSDEQAKAIMAYVETFEGGALVPFFALCLFAGIRPCMRTGEILKLKPEHVRLDTGVIHIEPEVSKVKMKRNVTIQPNLAAWLTAYPLDRFPIIPKNSQQLRDKVTLHFGLTHDVLRHTFISMHVAKFRSMGEAALQAGNSETIIRKHYLDLKTTDEAEKFFGILPTPVPVTSPAPLAFPTQPEALAVAS
ncbi:MAG: site-specific integrase [Opitutaceae bacterium]|jgi:integrase